MIRVIILPKKDMSLRIKKSMFGRIQIILLVIYIYMIFFQMNYQIYVTMVTIFRDFVKIMYYFIHFNPKFDSNIPTPIDIISR